MPLRIAFHISMLFAIALFVSWPILTDGYFTYMDNPVHLAEIYSLAESVTGWSDIAFDGFPLGNVHSPLWYGALVALVRFGLSAEMLYKIALFLGFVSPAIAIYLTCGNKQRGFAYASLYLSLHFVVSGITSPLAGMWTFGLSLSLFLFFIHFLDKAIDREGGYIAVAIFLGLVALTHLFTFIACIIYFGSAVALLFFEEGKEWRRIFPLSLSAILGATIGSFYIVPAASYVSLESLPRDVWSLAQILKYFFTAVDLSSWHWKYSMSINTFSLLAISSLFLGVRIAIFLLLSRPYSQVSLRRVASIVVILILLIADYSIGLPQLGPLPWRLFFFVPLLCISLLTVVNISFRYNYLYLFILFFIGTSLLIQRLYIEKLVPKITSIEVLEVFELWKSLRLLPAGRKIYIQDTFWTDPFSTKLSQSHILTLTSHETKKKQLGPYYGMLHFKNVRETSSEMNQLFGVARYDQTLTNHVTNEMERFHCNYLVLANPSLVKLFSESPRFALYKEIGRFSIFRFRWK